MSKMRLYIQTKSLSGWQTVASFTNQVEAAAAYLHVFRDYNSGIRLVEKAFDGRMVRVKVLQGKGDTRG